MDQLRSAFSGRKKNGGGKDGDGDARKAGRKRCGLDDPKRCDPAQPYRWSGGAATRTALAYAIGIVVVVLVLAVVGKWLASETRSYPERVVTQTRKLVQHASQQALAAVQDDNPLMSLMHINTAIAYVAAARRMMSAGDLARVTGVDIDELSRMLDDRQLQVMQRLHQACPALLPEGVFAVHSDWIA